ncbi:serine O-acetyltransferase [Oceanobacillus longus]|uniref:Serine acetyltransferase n=1 Tax=Oceanobacillus longus TaxID=930120 RepID=A0ABV8H281_9BACI
MSIRKIIKEELSNDGKKNILKIIFTLYISPKKRAIFMYRVSKMLYDRGYKYLPIIINNKLITSFGTYLSLKAEIGQNLEFRHLTGVVIGEGVKIGNNVIIYQQVTLGGQNLGDGKKAKYPVIEDNVTLFSGAKILGAVKVGENSIVGANSVVIKDVPKNSIVAGVPGRIIKENIL